jgi:hypothetical protein
MNKDTLGGRLEEALKRAWFISATGKTEVPPIVASVVTSFLREELERLAVEVEGCKIPVMKGHVDPEEYENIIGNNAALATAAALMRSKA